MGIEIDRRSTEEMREHLNGNGDFPPGGPPDGPEAFVRINLLQSPPGNRDTLQEQIDASLVAVSFSLTCSIRGS